MVGAVQLGSFRARKKQAWSWTGKAPWSLAESANHVAVGVSDASIRCFDASGAPRWKMTAVKGNRGMVHSLAFSPDGRLLAFSCDRRLFVAEAETGGLLFRSDPVENVSFLSPRFGFTGDSAALVWFAANKIYRWRFETDELESVERFERSWHMLQLMPVRHDGMLIVYGSSTHGDAAVFALDPEALEVPASLMLPGQGTQRRVQLSTSAGHVHVACPQNGPLVWDGATTATAATGEPLPLSSHAAAADGFVFDSTTSGGPEVDYRPWVIRPDGSKSRLVMSAELSSGPRFFRGARETVWLVQHHFDRPAGYSMQRIKPGLGLTTEAM